MPAFDSRGAPVVDYVPDEMHVVAMRDLLQGGVHFGHQTRRWNPKMKPYIFAERGGIYIIDLMKTTQLLDEAYAFVKETVARGGTILFVGTKKQCQEAIREHAQRVGMPYVANRWLGGLLTNFATISRRIRVLHEMREQLADGTLDKMPPREAIRAKGELQKLETNLGGVANMERLPSAVFVVDPHKEQIVVREARKLNIPLIGLVDTNCDPDEIDFVIPGNDDAIRSCALIIKVIADAVEEGKQLVSERDVRSQLERPGVPSAAGPDAHAPEARRRPSDRERGRGERRGGGRGGRSGGAAGPRAAGLGEAPIGRTSRTAAARDRHEQAVVDAEAAAAAGPDQTAADAALAEGVPAATTAAAEGAPAADTASTTDDTAAAAGSAAQGADEQTTEE